MQILVPMSRETILANFKSLEANRFLPFGDNNNVDEKTLLEEWCYPNALARMYKAEIFPPALNSLNLSEDLRAKRYQVYFHVRETSGEEEILTKTFFDKTKAREFYEECVIRAMEFRNFWGSVYVNKEGAETFTCPENFTVGEDYITLYDGKKEKDGVTYYRIGEEIGYDSEDFLDTLLERKLVEEHEEVFRGKKRAIKRTSYYALAENLEAINHLMIERKIYTW